MAVPDMNDLLKQAKEMQEQMQNAQKQIVSIEVCGQSGNGLVKVYMRGDHYVNKVETSKMLPAEGADMIADLHRAAFNDAVKKLEDETRNRMMDLAKDFQLPEGMEGLMNQEDDDNK